MDGDGWFDGMKILHAIVEAPDEKLFKLKWNTFNKGFMERAHGSFGWVIHKD